MNDLIVMIQIAGRRCALPARQVQSVIELGTVTPVPQSPDHIAGLTAMRSQALTVIDSRVALGFAADEWSTDSRAAVVAIDGHSYALLIDAIEDIATALGESGEITGGFGAEWTRVATGMIETPTGPALMLDMSELIAGPLGEGKSFANAA